MQDNPATDKFKEDIKAAVLNGSITISATSRSCRRRPGNAEGFQGSAKSPAHRFDLMTPWTAVSK